MYKIPEDIELELKKKYPNIHIQSFVNQLFQLILEKTLEDGSCTIREFGKFLAFKTLSSRLGKEVIRYKFKISSALYNRIKNDAYLLEKVPIKAKNTFSKKHEQACVDKQEKKQANLKASSAATTNGKLRTKEKVIANQILDIIQNSNGE